jgi:hypothetical protein
LKQVLPINKILFVFNILSFVRELATEFYSSIGHPSKDPVVFFKLQWIAFFEGIRSERQLMEIVSLNLAHRWFIGYDLDEPVPDHSSSSKIRERYGLEVFQCFFLFEHIEAASSFGKIVTKYDGKRLNGSRKPHYQRITDDRVSPTDPYSAPMQLSMGVLFSWFKTQFSIFYSCPIKTFSTACDVMRH